MPALSLAPLPLFHFYRDNLSIGKVFIDDHPAAERQRSRQSQATKQRAVPAMGKRCRETSAASSFFDPMAVGPYKEGVVDWPVCAPRRRAPAAPPPSSPVRLLDMLLRAHAAMPVDRDVLPQALGGCT